MGKRWRHWAICAAIVLVSTAAARFSGAIRFFHLLHLKAADAHFVLRGAQPYPNIVLLVADQKAFDKFSDLTIFWHPHYAAAISAAGRAGAKVIGLDLAFGVPVEKWAPDFDRLMAEAVSTSPVPVVAGYVSAFNTNQETLPVPINMIAAALGQSGYSNVTADDDDFLRRQELMEAADPKAPDAIPARSLAMRVAEKYLGQDAVLKDDQIILNGSVIPTSSPRTITINYAGPPDTFSRVSLADFLDAADRKDQAQLEKWVKDKIVLVGTDATGIDRFATPFYTMFDGPRWTTAGVEVHASTVRTIIEKRFLRPVSATVATASIMGGAVIAAVIISTLASTPAVIWTTIHIFALALLTHILFRMGWLLSTSEMMLGVLLCAAGTSAYQFWATHKRGALFRKAISLFVGDQLAKSLDDDEKIALSGRKIDVTILFTDIRGFTAFTEKISEQEGPETIVRLLNEYFDIMVALVVAHGGHVNKFIGDGILAVFSDEDKGARPGDHAIRAVNCATRMVTAPSKFKTGAGLHTGEVIVGNCGSAEKMEFTVLGDVVNLASRLESLNKEQHTSLLMSHATEAALGGSVATVKLGEVPVRGKTQPIYLYTVASLVPTEEKAPVHA